VKAHGKVNLCLLVGAPRSDGLHPIVSVLQPVDLADEVTMEPRGGERDVVDCPGVDGDNLALRALAGFRVATGWAGPPQRITIAKRIPVAAGMGGGSADAAAALRLASHASGLPVPDGLAMRLGADVPALLHGARALVTGAGEHVEALPGDRPGLVIVPLDAALGAGEVYRAFDVLGRARSDEELAEAAAILRTGALPDDLAVNDLETPARRLCRAIEPALEALSAAGAGDPMVTGSGPTVFGRARDAPAVAARLRAAGYERALAA
jgi:4-diphosphocytidyl-2-C-methyl-D-erythritol kinase